MAQLLLLEQIADRALFLLFVVFFIVSILTAHVTAVACPSKELPVRVCMQIQEHEDALSI